MKRNIYNLWPIFQKLSLQWCHHMILFFEIVSFKNSFKYAFMIWNYLIKKITLIMLKMLEFITTISHNNLLLFLEKNVFLKYNLSKMDANLSRYMYVNICN